MAKGIENLSVSHPFEISQLRILFRYVPIFKIGLFGFLLSSSLDIGLLSDMKFVIFEVYSSEDS